MRVLVRRLNSGVVLLAGVVLASTYVARYVTDPKRPGADAGAPLGWLGWFDQGVTLRSVAALAAGNLDPSQHHYPLGHPLLGVPGYWLAPSHAFAALGLVSLLGALAGFVALARRLGVAPALAATLFAVVLLSDPVMFRNWVLPWNTTPVAGLLWLLLAAMAAWIGGVRRPLAVGVMVGLIMVCRPTEALVAAVPLAAGAWADARRWRRGEGLAAGAWVRLGLAAAAVVAPVVALHLAIYGPHPSLYMVSSRQIGFTLHDLGWKAYVILRDPYGWFADGHGLLEGRGWYVLGLAGLVASLFGGPVRAMLAGTLAVHAALYLSYVDLLPTGLFRFMNVHYFMWAAPGYGLLGLLLLRDAWRPGRGRVAAGAGVAVAVALLGMRLEPTQVAPGAPAKAVDFDGPPPPFTETYFGPSVLVDALGPMSNGNEMRVFVALGGIRVVGLKRDIVGPVRWAEGAAPPGFAEVPVARRLRIGRRWVLWWGRRAGPRIPVPEA